MDKINIFDLGNGVVANELGGIYMQDMIGCYRNFINNFKDYVKLVNNIKIGHYLKTTIHNELKKKFLESFLKLFNDMGLYYQKEKNNEKIYFYLGKEEETALPLLRIDILFAEKRITNDYCFIPTVFTYINLEHPYQTNLIVQLKWKFNGKKNMRNQFPYLVPLLIKLFPLCCLGETDCEKIYLKKIKNMLFISTYDMPTLGRFFQKIELTAKLILQHKEFSNLLKKCRTEKEIRNILKNNMPLIFNLLGVNI